MALTNSMSLDDFIGKQVEVTAYIIKKNEGSSIRLKCPKRIINMLGIPEKGLLNVTGSSMRINLERLLPTCLRERKAVLLLFLSYMMEYLRCFIKTTSALFSLICKKSARYADGWRYCIKCQRFYQIYVQQMV